LLTTFNKCFPHKIKEEKTFMEIQSIFSLTKTCFLLINFSNDKQTNKSLKSDFLKTTFHEINGTKKIVYEK